MIIAYCIGMVEFCGEFADWDTFRRFVTHEAYYGRYVRHPREIRPKGDEPSTPPEPKGDA